MCWPGVGAGRVMETGVPVKVAMRLGCLMRRPSGVSTVMVWALADHLGVSEGFVGLAEGLGGGVDVGHEGVGPLVQGAFPPCA